MAIFWMQISSVQRSATASAAYRAGERLRDERSGELHNHTRRRDVLHAEIFLPTQFDDTEMAWARNRERLWNTAEHTEKRYNARVAREFQVSLPSELDPAQRLALARSFAGEVAERYRVAVDLAVHAPKPGSDPRHFHAHLLMTTREVTPLGLGAKTGLDLNGRERRRRELPDHRQEFINVRERWATLTNRALHEAHIDARIDHRSLAAQGIDREPLPRIPLGQLKMEQRGVPSELADHLRNTYRERVRERLQSSASGKSEVAATELSPPTARPTDVETIRRQAREAWLQMRQQEAHKVQGRARGSDGQRAAHDTDAQPEQTHDDLAM
jgi:ATP-dependent exoDNAse (exonuclease V) alpha subunit